ncbi:hypothetical protein DWF00_25195 [Bosea caraganae]|uniref:Uncharacterized protein n=1 Tax=Bosea caraganae TaxID=2763117 RepID=A0A370LAV8_9HYPH|nr:hypothetical protein [Bosea caraganae]RDJ21660.1 hypothetical protein DWF00_25195 [Bosea caraganae]RDJ28310.1 hypothetical protein DWE98_06960 [Bosea caraganae]
MARADSQDESGAGAPRELAMILLQLAASQAEIGPFARRGREAPQVAAARYRVAAGGAVRRKLGLVA